MRPPIAILVTVLALSTLVPAAPPQHARVELLAAPAASKQSLLLGIHFLFDPGWHIYWVNPGDSGQPPSVTWHLPAGFEAGEIDWPRPQRIVDSPQIVDYGYQDDVTLLVPLGASRASSHSPFE